jgi:hypothetical protein
MVNGENTVRNGNTDCGLNVLMLAMLPVPRKPFSKKNI